MISNDSGFKWLTTKAIARLIGELSVGVLYKVRSNSECWKDFNGA
jgi:hypothetical protein